MLARQRPGKDPREVRTTGGVRVSELVERLGVSDMTVRRDSRRSSSAGYSPGLHGRATAAGRSVTSRGFRGQVHFAHSGEAGDRGGRRAAAGPGASVALSAGTTTHAWRPRRWDPAADRRHQLVGVAEVLYEAWLRPPNVVLTGGAARARRAWAVVVAAPGPLHVDWLLWHHGMTPRPGFTPPNLAEAEGRPGAVASARRVAVVADNSKWGVVGLSTIATLSEVDVVVRTGAPARRAAGLGEQLRRVVLAVTSSK